MKQYNFFIGIINKLIYLFISISYLLTYLSAMSFSSDKNFNNKIVYSISPPRNCSTAFLRCIEARPDFVVMNEPSASKSFRALNADEFKHIILQKSENKNILLKEISYVVKDSLLKNKDIVKWDNVYVVCLMRNPHHAVISLCKQHGKKLSKSMFIREVGYKPLYEIFMYVKQFATNPPCIILSEDLYMNPAVTNRQLCNFLNVSYDNVALEWHDLGQNFLGKEWSNQRQKAAMEHWHGNAIHSTGFFIPTQYKVDANGQPTFEEVAEECRDICKVAYAENLKYYTLLLQEEAFFLKNYK